jgi:polysaccharide export outer membrane protein
MRHLLLAALLLVPLGPAIRAAEPERGPSSDYVLQPLDLLKVVVFQEPDLEREVRISQEYSINLPLIGSVNLTGRTVRQAEEMVRALYDADFLKNPQISIRVLEYTPRTVQVLGAVNQAGTIMFTPEKQMSIVEAIARAGGHSRLADLKKVRLTRQLGGGRTETFTINVDEVMKGVTSEPWLLQKDDVIVVPERIL